MNMIRHYDEIIQDRTGKMIGDVLPIAADNAAMRMDIFIATKKINFC
jgi:hypothetical protein